jgi:hypothetical protein
MYDSLAEIWRGWSKNFFIALGPHRWVGLALALPAAAALLVLYGAPWLGLAIAALSVAAHGAAGLPALAAACTATLFAFAARRALARGYGVAARAAWLQPLGAIVLAAILVNSALRAATGMGVAWKGRTYDKLEG